MAVTAKKAAKKVAKKTTKSAKEDKADAPVIPAKVVAPAPNDYVIDGKVWGEFEPPVDFKTFTPLELPMYEGTLPSKVAMTDLAAQCTTITPTPFGSALKGVAAGLGVDVSWSDEFAKKLREHASDMGCRRVLELINAPALKFLVSRSPAVVKNLKASSNNSANNKTVEQIPHLLYKISNMSCMVRPGFYALEDNLGVTFAFMQHGDPSFVYLVRPYMYFSPDMETRYTSRVGFIQAFSRIIAPREGAHDVAEATKQMQEFAPHVRVAALTAVRVPTVMLVSNSHSKLAAVAAAMFNAEGGNVFQRPTDLYSFGFADTNTTKKVNSVRNSPAMIRPSVIPQSDNLALSIWNSTHTLLARLLGVGGTLGTNVRFDMFVSHRGSVVDTLSTTGNIHDVLSPVLQDMSPEMGIKLANAQENLIRVRRDVGQTTPSYLI